MELARGRSKNERVTIGQPNVAQLRQADVRIGFGDLIDSDVNTAN